MTCRRISPESKEDRRRVLLCAYACGPGMGSEEGVGWQTAIHLANHHDIIVATTSLHRRSIENWLEEHPSSRLQIIFHDIPKPLSRLLRPLGKFGVELSYLCWLFTARPVLQRAHSKLNINVAQHVTYGRYWMPSPLAVVEIPFIWGPVGGGETTPTPLLRSLSFSGRLFECARVFVRRLFEKSPAMRRMASRCAIGFGTTEETRLRMQQLGGKDSRILNAAALTTAEINDLAIKVELPKKIRFVSVGRLLDWKGYHLALKAFASTKLTDAEYVLIGEGPARKSLEKLASSLDIRGSVKFCGNPCRKQVLDLIRSCHSLVHPSMHDSGGFVCLEAMAAGKPVICLDTGGPGLFVTSKTGFPIPPDNEETVVIGISDSMKRIALDQEDVREMGREAQTRVRRLFTVEHKVQQLLNAIDMVTRH